MQNTLENKDDMKKMQQDAIRRVQQMQSKAKKKLSQTSPLIKDTPVNKNPEIEKVDNQYEKKLKLKRHFNLSDDFLKSITQDNETNLILMLILLFMEDEVDSHLILALVYLIS